MLPAERTSCVFETSAEEKKKSKKKQKLHLEDGQADDPRVRTEGNQLGHAKRGWRGGGGGDIIRYLIYSSVYG